MIKYVLTYQTTTRFVDVNSLFRLSKLNPQLEQMSFKKLEEISQVRQTAIINKNLESQFENFVPYLIEFLQHKDKSEKIRLHALSILANLSLREVLRPLIISANGIEYFKTIVKSNDSYSTVEAQRIAAKGLVNLVSTKREHRLRVLTELADEIKLIYRGELDEIVATYIQTLLHSSENSQGAGRVS